MNYVEQIISTHIYVNEVPFKQPNLTADKLMMKSIQMAENNFKLSGCP